MIGSIMLAGCSALRSGRPLPNCPVWASGEELAGLLDDRGRSGLSLYDATFFQGKLYVGSSVGLLVFEESHLKGAFKCVSGSYDHFSDVVADPANGQLWVRNIFIDEPLKRFDGGSWRSIEIPIGPQPLTRLDIQKLKFFPAAKEFWMQTSGAIWRWDNTSLHWIAVPLPSVGCQLDPDGKSLAAGFCFVSIAPLEGGTALVFRSTLSELDQPLKREATGPDRIFVEQDGEWKNITPPDLQELYVKDIVSSGDVTFARTFDDSLFRISTIGLERIPSHGKIDALTVTQEGTLLAGFSDEGIFEFRDGWVKRFDYPTNIDGNDVVRLNESEGNILLLLRNFAVDENGEKLEDDRMWLNANGQLNEVRLNIPL
ncbi:MAG: hypothetical protein R2682_07310 [Pyrinomonadaceae bacterium]